MTTKRSTWQEKLANDKGLPKVEVIPDKMSKRWGEGTVAIPEPKEIDEKLSIELRHLADNAVLKGKPQGDEQCENCLYYLENTAEVSYCWHPKLRILVGADWWCQWWEKIPEDGG